jgi:MYXO-CTERM domain-containing protein
MQRSLGVLFAVLCYVGVWHSAAAQTTWQVAPQTASSAQMLAPVSQGPSRSLAASTAAVDLCAPCANGEQCGSGLCLIDNATGEGICSQKCTLNGTTPCPNGFTCTTLSGSAYNVCNPNDDTVCPSIYVGAALNDACQYNVAKSANSNTVLTRPCLGDLYCFVYPSNDGACLNKCSSHDPNYVCHQQGQICCFGLDANGYCAPSSQPTDTGGCIQIQQVGDSCVEPDQSVCVQGAGCFSPTQAGAQGSRCYGLCPTGSCAGNAVCATIRGAQVCCDAARYNINDASTCQPLAGSCKLGIGVACTLNADCKQNYCAKKGNQSACSRSCLSDADCPDASVDANGDGVPDGGGSCIDLGAEQKYCWPRQNPAAQPNCFLSASAAAAADPGGGCNCRSAAAAPLWGVALLGVALQRSRRRSRLPRR